MNKMYRNPILPGFYPDPSICRVGDDYYLVTSTFEFFPGLPVFHSRDLVHWQQIGHVLDRPSQLPLDGIEPSAGLYAPTIRYHEGTFYVINTLVRGLKESGNFIVTAADPAGPWSEPYWLDDAPGIDPSLFFDDDGRAWYTGNRISPEGERFRGHREIWLQELDLKKMQLKGEKHTLWDGALNEAVHTEAPHLYKIVGLYYLMVAEAGTGHNHAVTIARSEKISGPYENNPRNPILTHRHLGLDYPIVGTGHADLVQTQNGEWWMVLLAMRPYGGYFYNLGRESFLVPVIWEDNWPIVSPGIGRVEHLHTFPNLPEKRWPSRPTRDHFEAESLGWDWNFLRTPRESFWSLRERPGFLRLRLRPERLSELANPSFIGRRQRHFDFTMRTCMEFSPGSPNESAGVVLLQNHNFHYRFVVSQDVKKGNLLRLIQRRDGDETILAEKSIEGERVYLMVSARGQDYRFSYSNVSESWEPFASGVDGRILSTPVAGGFIGAYVGMYASSNGKTSENAADFDWFEYVGDEGE